MLRAKNIMSDEVLFVSPETEITQAAKLLLEKHLNGLPVVDHEGLLVGIICQSDLVFQQKKNPTTLRFHTPGRVDPFEFFTSD